MRVDATRSFRYPRRALGAAYALAGTGMLVGFGPLLFAHPASLFRWPLGAIGALFLVYCARTVVRQLTRIELHASGIGARGPLGTAIRWEEMRAFRLNYYSTRPDRSGGWMELIVQGQRRSIRIESTLDGFVELVREAAGEARSRGLVLDERSRANLHALGVTD
jgi:hypothetical protein